MLEVTKYFRNAMAASSQGVIEYKNNDFCEVKFTELLTGKLSEAAQGFVWRSKQDIDLDEEVKGQNRNVIIALKTISTEFVDSISIETNIEEMTSVLFLPAIVDKFGYLQIPDDGKMPWIPREYLTPMEEPQLAIGENTKYDEYYELTTGTRNQIHTWEKYYKYAIAMYEHVTGSKFDNSYITCGKDRIKLDGKYYLFIDTIVNASFHIMQLYNHLLRDGENSLYTKLTNGKIEPSKQLLQNTNINKMKKHVGQMGGEYPLSPSQREAINHFDEIMEGDILAVSGPHGTGKTTLLQSIVANMYVETALKNEKAPIIVAASTNNQAVTNIIDSFGKISEVGIMNLEKKWITGSDSFATYFPSKGKVKEAQRNNYQYTTVNGGAFIDVLESEENRNNAKEYYREEFSKYFGRYESDFSVCEHILWHKLKYVNDSRIKTLDLIEKIKNTIGEHSYATYAQSLMESIESKEHSYKINHERMESLKSNSRDFLDRSIAWRTSYDKLPWYIRLLKFLPCFRNKILLWSFSFIKDEELAILRRDMKIEEIEQKYRDKINENDLELFQLAECQQALAEELEKSREKYRHICSLLEDVKNSFYSFREYRILPPAESDIWNQFDICVLNGILDKVRYVEFWFAVHYYESRWLMEDNPISEKQRGTTFELVLDSMYHRLAMISPCQVMTFFMLPKHFFAYNGNDKNHYYLYNYIDLLIVDEAGQISPEVAAPSFSLAKKAVVVGDEEQIPPVWGNARALDIAMAISNKAITKKEEFSQLEWNGLNCSQSSIMKVASLSCGYNKYKKGLFLCEHRRCYNEIVAYCNKLVYEGRLEPKRGNAAEDKNNVLAGFLPVMGHKQVTIARSQQNGRSRQNREEAKEIVAWLRTNYGRIADCYSKNGKYPIKEKELVGVITPFKSQSVLIKKLMKRDLSQYANLIDVGTVHTFQGAERKVIIFSSVYGHEEGCYFINRTPNLMNVAVSRAKDSFLMFGDKGCLAGGEKTAAGLLKNMTEESL